MTVADLPAPALDPEGLWRGPWPDASDPAPDLRRLGARERAHLLACVAEWTGACPVPAIQMGGELLLRALAEALAGEPIGRALGIEPPAGLTLRRAALLRERDELLHRARAARPEWRTASARRAATLIHAALDRYRANVWPRERGREAAPAAEPAASFWRICRLEAGGGPKAVGSERIAQIFELADGPAERPEQLDLL
ncbi:hypothetical protein GQF56_08560 [Rhodobacter sphaeroides]|jgi:hypothetical protein|uniref:Uncharacterized protein n=1 Tax=Cereibacter sphaeroides (strain ATCC 17023 / DSM 158 / JCM 6121 / CCUG 31486 / LMG 2827 / NBRC 12203 / NCIMB 8253 / ATH 2.4.1.) TaxID=272943 RepID=Q3J2S5_CERS4|nr:hypothetical protein [Cereibacter sphaeroides]ABA78909.1 hypothetical protein RSP_2754 [Cereibacter sphaeroides 2.4.1]AMJ47239.1 hypothetical protein APX01_06735 [Cereibacter sphaeroides]ANS33951.1 hypothetical protein A3858_06755 [Cereibacter sphaeroides]ATN62995.1 hypothetical protein A3857_06750 [Cereibacter sphaeroides]AXC61118.1 hypothetical protein DQL45_06980 [Cereibacter sphaeroides 2.4.1]